MKTIFTFLIFVSLYLPVSSPAGEVRVDWEGAFYGQPGSVQRDPERRLDLAPTGRDNLRLVDKATEPPSPFAGGEAALLVDSTAESPYWLRLCFRPFEGPEAQQGTVEFLLHPLEGRPEYHLGRLFVGPMAAVLAAPDDMHQAGDPLLAR